MPSIRMGTTLRSDAAPTMPHMLAPRSIHPRLLARTLPARDGDLARPRHRQLARGGFLDDRAAAADRRTGADRDRRDEHAVRPDVHVVTDERLVLVRSVVVRGDRARAVVHAAAEDRVADVGEMIRLRPGAERACLHFDEVADVDLLSKVCAGSEARVRADAAVPTDRRRIEVRERLDEGAGPDGHVAQHAVGADVCPVVEAYVSLEDAADVDGHIATADDVAADVDARWVDDRRAGHHQHRSAAALYDPLEQGELRAVVDAEHRALVGHDVRGHGHAFGNRHGDDVGKVILLLRVVRSEALDPAREQRGRRRDEAAVDLVDRALALRGVALLDDRLHAAGLVAHDAPEPEWAAHARGQQRQAILLRELRDA